jgi:hypothetical protein
VKTLLPGERFQNVEDIKKNKGVKLSCYRPGEALGIPGG